MNTLYLIGRMWDVVQSDSKLRDAVGLTPEEIQETQANIALHKTITKALEAKKALLEYTLYKRDMTPEQLKQAGCEILFENMVCKSVLASERDQSEIVKNHPEYMAQFQIVMDSSNTYQKKEALKAAQEADDKQAIASLEAEIADMPKKGDMAQKRCNLLSFNRPGHACNIDFLNGDWVKAVKEGMRKDSSLDKILTMKREDLGKLLGSRTDFSDAFAPVKPAPQKDDLAAGEMKKEMEIQTEAKVSLM